MKPLITNRFRATTIPKAFLLNAMATGMIALIAVETRAQLDKHKLTESTKVIINLGTTLLSALITYWTMYVLFNFGGGMLTN